jgi:sulfur relay protein TusB/DsrH
MVLFQLVNLTPNPVFNVADATDAVLLRQDAVYLLRQQCHWPTRQLYVLEQDLQQRGVELPAGVHLVNDEQWVELVLKAHKVILC